MNRTEALKILNEWVKSPSLLRHCQAVEQVMRRAAGRYGSLADAPEQWGLAGLLHDADWEAWPDEHPHRIVHLLRDQGEESLAYCISCHGTAWGIPPRSAMDRALVACDELTGFIVACALPRPDGVLSLKPAGVLKKLKDPRFAAGVDRAEIYAGVALLGVDAVDHIAFVIESLMSSATELGLDAAKRK